MSHSVYAFGEERRVKKLTEQVSSQPDRPTGRQMDRQTIDRQIWTEMDTWTIKHMDSDGWSNTSTKMDR